MKCTYSLKELLMIVCKWLACSRAYVFAATFAVLFVLNMQQVMAQEPLTEQAPPAFDDALDLQPKPDSAIRPSESVRGDSNENAKQSKRILGIFPTRTTAVSRMWA